MLINVDSRTVLLELTNKCYTGCTADYCYKKLTVSTKGQHIPLEVITKRIDWIKKFVRCNTITILGGDHYCTQTLNRFAVTLFNKVSLWISLLREKSQRYLTRFRIWSICSSCMSKEKSTLS